MERNSEGLFAISKAGHDKGTMYVIVREENDYVYVADGVLKTLQKPKKKNKKHIQIIKKKAVDLIAGEEHVNNTDMPANDEQVKRAIRLYR